MKVEQTIELMCQPGEWKYMLGAVLALVALMVASGGLSYLLEAIQRWVDNDPKGRSLP